MDGYYFLRRSSYLAVALVCFWVLPADAGKLSFAALAGIGVALIDRLLENLGADPEDALVYLVLSLIAFCIWAGIAWAYDVSLLGVVEFGRDYPRYLRATPFMCVASLTAAATAYLLAFFSKPGSLPFDGDD